MQLIGLGSKYINKFNFVCGNGKIFEKKIDLAFYITKFLVINMQLIRQ